MEITDWSRFAHAVTRRRAELGLHTMKELADAMGVTARVISDVENARRSNYSTRLLADLERVLQWHPGSVERVLRGGDPFTMSTESGSYTPTGYGEVAADRLPAEVRHQAIRESPALELLDEVRRRLTALESGQPDLHLGGLTIQFRDHPPPKDDTELTENQDTISSVDQGKPSNSTASG